MKWVDFKLYFERKLEFCMQTKQKALSGSKDLKIQIKTGNMFCIIIIKLLSEKWIPGMVYLPNKWYIYLKFTYVDIQTKPEI